MSLISALGPNLVNLPDIIVRFEEYLDEANSNLSLKGKSLQAANVEHATWCAYYDQKRAELNAIKKYLEREVDRIRGKMWKQIHDKNDLATNTKDKDQFINQEPAYLAMNEMYLEVLEIYEKFVAVVEAFKSRGYALNNIVKLRISAIQDDII